MDILNKSPLHFGDLTVPVPVIQGGMGVGVSMSGLASAVANCGGIGVISAAAPGYLEPDFATNYLEANIRGLRKEIKKAKEKTKGIIGMNIMVAMTNFGDMVRTSIEEGVDIIFAGAGLPLNLPSYLTQGSKTKLVPIISSARGAALIAKKWIDKFNYAPDGFVVEGPLAGGHLGFKYDEVTSPDFALENILPPIIAEAKKISERCGKQIPVIAAGGIYTGADIKKFLDLGADGVQLGSRFVTTQECDTSIEFKQSYINAKKEDITLIKSPVGLPGRAITNQFLSDVTAGIKTPKDCPFQCIHTCNPIESPYCIIKALINASKGKMKYGFSFAGANAYKATSIISVAELFEELDREYPR